jgi:integrase
MPALMVSSTSSCAAGPLSLQPRSGARATSSTRKTRRAIEVTRIKAEIRAGTFRRAADDPIDTPSSPVPTSGDTVTVDSFVALYLERSVQASGKTTWTNDASMLKRFREFPAGADERLGDATLTAITEDRIEAFFASLQPLAASTRNQYVQVLKASFRWAARKGYLTRSPISDESSLKRTKVAQRRRRLTEDEERRILATAGTARHGAGLRLQWLIIAALETGARQGELLALRWADVDLDKRTVLIRAVEVGAKKTSRARELPMSARLKATFEMAQTDAKQRSVHGPAFYVFGNGIGGKLGNVKRAWETAVLKSAGHTPVWVKHGLATACREALATVDLHFHDLRHEAGCRWLENGVPLHHVQELLGHTSLAQTSTYLHASEFGLRESMQKFDASRAQSVPTEQTIAPPSLGHDEHVDVPKGVLH